MGSDFCTCIRRIKEPVAYGKLLWSKPETESSDDTGHGPGGPKKGPGGPKKDPGGPKKGPGGFKRRGRRFRVGRGVGSMQVVGMTTRTKAIVDRVSDWTNVAVNDIMRGSVQNFAGVSLGVKRMICCCNELNKIPFVPISGFQRNNMIERPTNLDWYKGVTLLETLCQSVEMFQEVVNPIKRRGSMIVDTKDDLAKGAASFTSMLLQNVPPLVLIRFLREHGAEWADYGNDAYAAASLRATPFAVPCGRSGGFPSNQVIVPLAQTLEHEKDLKVVRLGGHAGAQNSQSESGALLNETKEFVGGNVAYALAQCLEAIACVCETLEEREAGSNGFGDYTDQSYCWYSKSCRLELLEVNHLPRGFRV